MFVGSDATAYPGMPPAVIRANGSRECAPDDRLREAIHSAASTKVDCFVATLLAILDARVDRPRHQGERRGPRGMIVLAHDRGRRQRRHRGLADRHHMRAGTELVHEGDKVVGVVLKAKAAVIDGNVARAMLLSRSPPGTRISFKSTINCATCRVIGAAKRAAHVATVHQLFEHERRLGHRIA
jgi:hypothetical protein